MKRTYLSLIILMLVIGFAAVTTNLIINGKINIGFNEDEFNEGVIFSYVYTDTGKAVIDKETEKELTFETITLVNKGEQSILDYDIANKSEQYDANVTLNCNIREKEYEGYVTLKNTVESEFTLDAGQTKSGKITITLVKPATENIDINLVCEINATAQPREDRQEYVPLNHDYKEELLKGADPVLSEDLVPIIINEENGTVTKADLHKEWYKYEEKRWANAVILTKEGKEKNFQNNEVIDEQYIESYFVWIPKYRYKLFDENLGKYTGATKVDETKQNKAIEIEFGLVNTKDDKSNEEHKECETPMLTNGVQGESGGSGQCNNNEWMTHPAFLAFDTNGFWVGKFEVGYKQNNDLSTTETWTLTASSKDEKDSSKIIIKPNIYAWRGLTLGNAYKSAKEYKELLNSHMIKNTEWGAVAYLTQSVYGRCENENSCSEVILNNSTYLTGYGAINAPSVGGTNVYTDYETPSKLGADGQKTLNYNNKLSTNSSTTGNYTGIYDMNGSAWEYTASVMLNNTNTTPMYESSGLTATDLNDAKYYDVYKYNNLTGISDAYNLRILGDAIGEMGPFGETWSVGRFSSYYKDWLMFVVYNGSYHYTWFMRGGEHRYGTYSGIFTSIGWNGSNGSDNPCRGFRVVLAPQ